MAVKKKTQRKAKIGVGYSALKLTQNSHTFYYSTIPVEDLFHLCFVSRRDDDGEVGFQRQLAIDRAEDIAKYLNNSLGSIPTNIVLSAQPEANLKFKAKQINYTRAEKSFLVLDGQHRLYGYHLCEQKFGKSYRVPVAIYNGLSRSDEARLFIDINTNQRGVPATLLLDIKQVAKIETDLEVRLRDLFDFLNKNENSPIAGKLSPSKSTRGKINRVTFNRALTDVLRSDYAAQMGDEKFKQLTLNYIKAVELVLPSFSVMYKATIFESLFAIFEDVIQNAISQYGNLKVKSLKESLAPIRNVDLKSTKSGSKQHIIKALKAILKSKLNVEDIEL